MRVGGTQGGQPGGPSLVPLQRVASPNLLQAHTWIVKPRRAPTPGSFPGTSSIPSASELPHLALGAKPSPWLGGARRPSRPVRVLGAGRGAGLPARCCPAATLASLCFVPQRQWQFGINGVRTPGLAAAPCCLEELSASFPPPFFSPLPFRFSFSTSFGFETLVIFKETMVLLTPPWCSQCPCF